MTVFISPPIPADTPANLANGEIPDPLESTDKFAAVERAGLVYYASFSQFEELFQAKDADLTDIAALTPAKGTILVYDGANWISLGVGTDTYVLVADSAQASGVKWAVASAAIASPTVEITSSEASPTAANPIPITITFSRPMLNFAIGDITVGGGVASNFVAVSESVYTADITPTSNGTVTIDIAADAATDYVEVGNEAAPQFSIESVAPATVEITSSASSPTTTNPIPITITFSQDVTGFVIGDITVGGGTLSNFVAVSGSVYTANITPTARAVTVDVAQDVTDGGNEAAPQFAITYDAFFLTCTMTGVEVFSLQRLNTSSSVTVYWGDGTSNTYTSGIGKREHDYAGPGTYIISITGPITELDLRGIRIGGLINSDNLMPSGLTFLKLFNLSGFTWTVGASAPMPSGLTLLDLDSLSGLSWTVGASAPIPSGVNTLKLIGLSGLAVITYWTGATALQTIQYENNLSSANLDSTLAALWSQRNTFTYTSPSLDIAGGGNGSPGGTLQAQCPPTTGKEYIYELVNDSCGEGFKKWSVTYT